MFVNQTVTGVLIDEVALDLDELARACQVEPDWVLRHVQAGVLGETLQVTKLRFRARGDLPRALDPDRRGYRRIEEPHQLAGNPG